MISNKLIQKIINPFMIRKLNFSNLISVAGYGFVQDKKCNNKKLLYNNDNNLNNSTFNFLDKQNILIKTIIEKHSDNKNKCLELLTHLYINNNIKMQRSEAEYFYKKFKMDNINLKNYDINTIHFNFCEQYKTIHQIVKIYKNDVNTAIFLLKSLYYVDQNDFSKRTYMTEKLAYEYFRLYSF